jgi:hypothetical protein
MSLADRSPEDEMRSSLTRRHFLAFLPLALMPSVASALRVRAPRESGRGPKTHPEPRPGITAAHVLPDSKLTDKSAAPVYAMVREIPQIVDGIRCSCGCADLEGFYSLLSCYEAGGMAQHCVICQGQARLAYQLHADGWSLKGIRTSIDAAYGE